MKIPISKPFFDTEEFEAVRRPLESGWVVQGPFVKEFEDKFAAWTHADYAAATSSCTTALHICVAALGLKPGQEVIVPAFTWVSTANVVEYMGARPVFCDIDLGTFNIDEKQIESHITPRTVGIIPVHLFGLCANMDAIMSIARKHGLWVVEDAACAFGGWYRGRHAGTFGDAGCFSFHPRKSITTGEGGMITTSSAELDALGRSLRDHGASRSDLSRHLGSAGFLLPEYRHLGYNYRMTDLQAAVGVAQISKADRIMKERTRRAALYDSMLSSVDYLRTPLTPDDCVHGYQAYVCLFQPEEPSLSNVGRLFEQRNRLMTHFEEMGIATRQGTHAPVLLNYYAEKYALRPEQYPNSWLADHLTLALPLYVQMTDAEQDRVVQALGQGIPMSVAN